MKGAIKLILYDSSDDKYVIDDGSTGGNRTDLVCDVETKVVYFKHVVYYSSYSYAYMCPYIGPKGKFCRLIDNQIVEIG